MEVSEYHVHRIFLFLCCCSGELPNIIQHLYHKNGQLKAEKRRPTAEERDRNVLWAIKAIEDERPEGFLEIEEYVPKKSHLDQNESQMTEIESQNINSVEFDEDDEKASEMETTEKGRKVMKQSSIDDVNSDDESNHSEYHPEDDVDDNDLIHDRSSFKV